MSRDRTEYSSPFDFRERRIDKKVGDVVADILGEALSAAQRPPPSPWMCRKEAADYLGISLPTLDRYRRKEGLPFHVRGGRAFFHRRQLDAFILGEGAKDYHLTLTRARHDD